MAALEARLVQESGYRQTPWDVLRLAALNGEHPGVVGVVAWRLRFGEDVAWRCSRRWWEQLERSAAAMDRDPWWPEKGAAGAFLVDLIRDHGPDAGPDAASLAFFIRRVKQMARESRRHRRHRAGHRPTTAPLRSWKPRGERGGLDEWPVLRARLKRDGVPVPEARHPETRAKAALARDGQRKRRVRTYEDVPF